MSRRQTRPNSITAALTTNYPDHSDEEVMQALVTAGALIALADGEIAAIERDALVNYLDRQGFVPTMSSHDIAEAFDNCVEQLKDRDGPEVIMNTFRPLAVCRWRPLWFAPRNVSLRLIGRFIRPSWRPSSWSGCSC